MHPPRMQGVPIPRRCGRQEDSLFTSAPVVGTPVILGRPVMLRLLHAFAGLLDQTGGALVALDFNFVAAGAGVGVEIRWWRRGATGAVALIGGVTKRRFGGDEKSALFAGVIDLDQLAVFVLGGEAVTGKEVGVGTVQADSEQLRVEGARATRDQAHAIAGTLAVVGLSELQVPCLAGSHS